MLRSFARASFAIVTAIAVAAAPLAPRADDLSIAAVQGAAEYSPGSRAAALFRSILVPGYGQLYNGQPVKAGIVFGTELALLSTALAFHLAGEGALAGYSRQTAAQAGTDPSGRAQRLYDDAQSRYRVRDALLFAATGIWVLNIIDAYVCGGKGRSLLDVGTSKALNERKFAPLASIRPGEAVLGVQGHF